MPELDFEKKHLTNIVRARSSIDKSFTKGIDDLSKELAQYDIRNPKSFDWSRHAKLDKRVNVILGELNSGCYKSVRDSMVLSWNLANQKNDFLTNQYLKNVAQTTGMKQQYFNQNTAALNSWINRTEDGVKLSERIWDTTQGMKEELFTHIGNGIATGKSAASISRDVRKVLKDPDKLFRRVNKDGKLVLSNPAKNFKPGTGKYRSSYKNALRLTATETNMAYRMSDYTRRGQLDFVVGFEVHLSGSHPRPDICDDLKGKYPKDFIYRGWHPWCLCFTTSILQSNAEYNREQAGEFSKKRESVQGEGSGVQAVSDWAKTHNDYLQKTKSTPYFIGDNFQLVDSRQGNLYVLNDGIIKKVTYKAGETIVTTIEEAEAEMEKWWKNADQKSKDALFEYTTGEYRPINRQLLGIDQFTPERIKEFENANRLRSEMLNKGPKWKGEIYRGTVGHVNAHEKIRNTHVNLMNSSPNYVFKSDSYFSMSIEKKKANGFAGIKMEWDDLKNYKLLSDEELKTYDYKLLPIRIRFELDSKYGTTIWKYSDIKYEMEVIGDKGGMFKVISKEVRLVNEFGSDDCIFVVLKVEPK